MITLNEPFKKNMNQEEWLKERKKFITATEASALMGVNPYMTPSKLIKEKSLAPVPMDNDFMKRGLENEKDVLQTAAEWLHGTLVEVQGFYANPLTRISATPDAILSDGRLIEAKCTGMKNYPVWSTYPPTYYIMQCQVQMYVTGARENHIMARFFYDWPSEKCVAGADRMYKITYSEEIMKKCVDKVREFWQHVKDGTTMRNNAEESAVNEALLKATCEQYRGKIMMHKFEVDPTQLSIVRQTCLKAAAKLGFGLDTAAVVELAQLIEEEVFLDIASTCGDNSKNFLIQIGACVNGFVEGNMRRSHESEIVELRRFVIEGLKYVTRDA
jgi:putative phage-type endonuclease